MCKLTTYLSKDSEIKIVATDMLNPIETLIVHSRDTTTHQNYDNICILFTKKTILYNDIVRTRNKHFRFAKIRPDV